MLYQNHWLTSYTVKVFCNSIKKNHWTRTWKTSLTKLTGLGLTLWYNGLELEKCLNYLNGVQLIWWYTGIRLEKYSEYLTGYGLILWYIGLGVEK